MTDQTDANELTVPSQLVGIRDWLILPAISLVLGAIALAIILMLMPFFGAAKMGNGVTSVDEITLALILLIFLLYTANRFFRKKSNAPYMMIFLMVTNLLILSYPFEVELFDFTSRNVKMLIGGIIYAAIWIPYFIMSKRVNATFVK